MFLRVLVNGTTAYSLGSVRYDNTDQFNGFVRIPNPGAGTYTLQLQYMSSTGASTTNPVSNASGDYFRMTAEECA
jgi:hypothetical protein